MTDRKPTLRLIEQTIRVYLDDVVIGKVTRSWSGRRAWYAIAQNKYGDYYTVPGTFNCRRLAAEAVCEAWRANRGAE